MRRNRNAYLHDTPRCIGLLGDPVAQSLSPTIHNAAFQKQKLNFVYVPLLVHPQHLKNAITALQLTDIEGCNVTTPHKQAIIPFLDRLDPSAQLAGAVNTIYRRGAKWIGANTDGIGFLMACKLRGVRLTGRTITILGAGGVASAILAALLKTRVRHIIILNRSLARAKKLRTRLFQKSKITVTIAPLTADSYRHYFPETDILIHATSVGLGKSRPLAIPLQHLPPKAVVCDCQYRREGLTPLIRHAQRRKHLIIDGLDLLLTQAAESYRIWTGHRAPLPIMRRAVKASK